MRVENSTREEYRASIWKVAPKDLEKHVLTEIGTAGDTQAFECGQPDSGAFRFRVILWPGWIVVCGDVGDTMIQSGSGRGIGWLRGAINSPDYLFEKIRSKQEVFLSGEAELAIEALATGHGEFLPEKRPTHPGEAAEWDTEAAWRRERAEKVRDEWEADEGTADAWYGAWYGAGLDEPPDCTDVGRDHLWALECLRWFVTAYDKQQSAQAAQKGSAA